MWDRLEETERRYRELEAEMARPEVAADYDRLQKLAREHASMQEVVGILGEYRRLHESLDEARAILDDGSDPELVSLARDEVERDESRLELLEDRLQRALVPQNPFDQKDVIVEIRAAAGGDEATLFASDLFRMYSRYAERQRWAVEVLDSNQSDLGGLKEIVFEVRGRGAASSTRAASIVSSACPRLKLRGVSTPLPPLSPSCRRLTKSNMTSTTTTFV